MNDLRLERNRAQRLLALVLRENLAMQPEPANKLAEQMVLRLMSATADPIMPRLQGYRMIKSHPPDAHELANALRKEIADADHHLARSLWDLIYERCPKMPADVVV